MIDAIAGWLGIAFLIYYARHTRRYQRWLRTLVGLPE